jgi:hypothetical protein
MRCGNQPRSKLRVPLCKYTGCLRTCQGIVLHADATHKNENILIVAIRRLFYE